MQGKLTKIGIIGVQVSVVRIVPISGLHGGSMKKVVDGLADIRDARLHADALTLRGNRDTLSGGYPCQRLLPLPLSDAPSLVRRSPVCSLQMFLASLHTLTSGLSPTIEYRHSRIPMHGASCSPVKHTATYPMTTLLCPHAWLISEMNSPCALWTLQTKR